MNKFAHMENLEFKLPQENIGEPPESLSHELFENKTITINQDLTETSNNDSNRKEIYVNYTSLTEKEAKEIIGGDVTIIRNEDKLKNNSNVIKLIDTKAIDPKHLSSIKQSRVIKIDNGVIQEMESGEVSSYVEAQKKLYRTQEIAAVLNYIEEMTI